MFPGLRLRQALQVFKLTSVCPEQDTKPLGQRALRHVPLSAFQWCLLSIWTHSTPLSALLMQSVSKWWVTSLGQATYNKHYSSEPQPKANKQRTPSNPSETGSALPGVRTWSWELTTIFHEQNRAHLFNSYVWEKLLGKLWDWRPCLRRDWGPASHN